MTKNDAKVTNAGLAGLTRRGALRSVAAVAGAAALALGLFTSDARAQDGHPLFFGWTGYDSPETLSGLQ